MARNTKTPSALTSVVSAARKNDIYTIFFCVLKNNTNTDVIIKMYNPSVIPKTEFSIILGSKINIDDAPNAYFLSENFLHH